MGWRRDLFKKITKIKENFQAKMKIIKTKKAKMFWRKKIERSD